MNKEETRTRIGQRVKALRLMADLSQDELAQRAGLQRTHIGRIEGGKYAVNIETLQAIAEAPHTRVLATARTGHDLTTSITAM